MSYTEFARDQMLCGEMVERNKYLMLELQVVSAQIELDFFLTKNI